MGVSTVVFLAIGGLALLLLVLSLVGGHLALGDVDFGPLHLDHVPGFGHVDGGMQLTLPAIAGFLGAFGFSGAAVTSVAGDSAATVVLAVVVGLGCGLPTAMLSARLMRAAVNINTDPTPTSEDLLGTLGVVVTPVPVDGYGEVRLTMAGQQTKVNAKADRPLACGTEVLVFRVLSPTSVLVEPIRGGLPTSPETAIPEQEKEG